MSFRVLDDKAQSKWAGRSKGIIIDNRDPAQKGRVKVASVVFGTTGFIPYIHTDDAFYGPPDIGAVVYVVAAGGDPDYPVAIGVVNDGPASDPDTPSPFRRDVPTNRGWVSPGELDNEGRPVLPNGGHSIELDDGLATVSDGNVTQTAESRGVRVTTSGGHLLRMMEEGADGAQENRVEAKTTGGQSVEMVDDSDAAGQQVVVKDADGRTIEIIKATDKITIRNQNKTIFIDIDLANDIIEIDANNVKLGTNAAQSIVRGDAFRTLFNAHRHVSGAPGVPTGPPIQPMDPASANTHLSDKHKVE